MKKLISLFIMITILFACKKDDPKIEQNSVVLQNKTIQYWGYQIQNINEETNMEELKNSKYDMLVIEPTRTDWSSDDKNFDTKSFVSQLKQSKAHDGINQKLVIAYIDIGEAEDWRWYWTWSTEWIEGQDKPNDWPDYIVKHDPDGWGGNYPVAFWKNAWKDIVIYGENQNSSPYGDYNSIIDEVIRDGFDGIYLDWVEAAEDSDIIALAENEGLNAVNEMITFIGEMKTYAKSRNPNFIIIQQNAASIIDGHPELANVIDAIAQEAIWFDGDASDNWNDENGYDNENTKDLSDYYLNYLTKYKNANIPIFNCEYANKNSEDAYDKSNLKGFIPYCTNRSLSKLTENKPFGY